MVLDFFVPCGLASLQTNSVWLVTSLGKYQWPVIMRRHTYLSVDRTYSLQNSISDRSRVGVPLPSLCTWILSPIKYWLYLLWQWRKLVQIPWRIPWWLRYSSGLQKTYRLRTGEKNVYRTHEENHEKVTVKMLWKPGKDGAYFTWLTQDMAKWGGEVSLKILCRRDDIC